MACEVSTDINIANRVTSAAGETAPVDVHDRSGELTGNRFNRKIKIGPLFTPLGKEGDITLYTHVRRKYGWLG